MGLEIEQQQRAEHTWIPHRHRQRERPRIHRPIGEPELQVQRNRPAIGPLERLRQRIQQSREDERQRLEQLDRPLELARLDEPADAGIRHERSRIAASGQLLESTPFGPQSRRQRISRQRRQITQRGQAPAAEHVEAAASSTAT